MKNIAFHSLPGGLDFTLDKANSSDLASSHENNEASPIALGLPSEPFPFGDSHAMHSKAIGPLLLAGVLGIVGLTVWPGCATPPLPPQRTPIASLKRTDFAFLKRTQPDRIEVERRLGKPDDYDADDRIACYRVNAVTRRELWLFLGIIPINVETTSVGEVEVAFVQFGANDQVQQSGMEIVRLTRDWRAGSAGQREESLKSAGKQWLAGKENKQRGR